MVRPALAGPRPRRARARRLGVSPAFGSEALAAYNGGGPAACDTPGRGGRRRCYRPPEDGRAFLEPFTARARAGQVATAGQVKAAWEEHWGRPVHETTGSRLLARHGWRKLAPRPAHPQADPEGRERSTRGAARASRP